MVAMWMGRRTPGTNHIPGGIHHQRGTARRKGYSFRSTINSVSRRQCLPAWVVEDIGLFYCGKSMLRTTRSMEVSTPRSVWDFTTSIRHGASTNQLRKWWRKSWTRYILYGMILSLTNDQDSASNVHAIIMNFFVFACRYCVHPCRRMMVFRIRSMW